MKTVIVIFFLYVTCSCLNKTHKVNIPPKPKGVPEKAFWKKGAQGGHWYVIESINNHRNNAIISIFNDHDGSLIISKSFMKICPIDSLEFIKDLHEEIKAFDGEKILLNSRCYLQPR